MENLQIYLLGFLAQSLFGARLVIQWWLSEKSKAVVSPKLFWYLSLGGSFLFLCYGVLRADLIIVFGQIISYYIYIRNLQLKGAWHPTPQILRIGLLFLPGLPFMLLGHTAPGSFTTLDDFSHPIFVLGAIGQLGLNLRFVYQWYYSEKSNSSVLPYGFWAISTWASVLVIIYSLFHPVYDVEPVLLVSQTMGIVPYIRNMMLSRKASAV